MNKSEFFEFFKKVPKAELHIHIEAVMSRDTIKKLYLKKNGVEFSDSEIKKLFSYSDLNGFIAAFLKVQDLFTEVSDFDLIFDDLKNYLVRNGIDRFKRLWQAAMASLPILVGVHPYYFVGRE